jgi:hypothetical protein
MLRRDRRDTPTQGALEYVAQELHTQAFADLGAAEQQIVRDDAEERYYSTLSCAKAGRNMATSRWICRTISPTGDNRYPKNRQQTPTSTDKYSKTAAAKPTQSEGLLIQGGGRGGSGGRRW